ncbi:MAG: BlaI/MecI/CopY family transcriptional regulator [Oscillospiraceae bacterium]|nr:BlaI/MecI/CopY family transcriptional regulator [Oscillospiraceae bacterium]
MKREKLPSRSEYKVMELLWSSPGITARDAAKAAEKAYGWNKNTTYTLLKSLAEKGILRREEPGFCCHPLLSREEARRQEADRLASLLFDGDRGALLAFLLQEEAAGPAAKAMGAPSQTPFSAPARGKRLH